MPLELRRLPPERVELPRGLLGGHAPVRGGLSRGRRRGGGRGGRGGGGGGGGIGEEGVPGIVHRRRLHRRGRGRGRGGSRRRRCPRPAPADVEQRIRGGVPPPRVGGGDVAADASTEGVLFRRNDLLDIFVCLILFLVVYSVSLHVNDYYHNMMLLYHTLLYGIYRKYVST